LRAEAELRHVGFADDDGAGGLLALHHAAIEVRNKIAVQRRSVGGADARSLVQVFHSDGNAVERPEPLAFGQRFVRCRGLRHQLLFGYVRNHRVDLGIDAIDLLQVRLHQFTRREFFLADEVRHIHGTQETEIRRCV
jgi:hypothetical protein